MVMPTSGSSHLPADQTEQHCDRNCHESRIEERTATLDPGERDRGWFVGSREAAVVLIDEALSLEPQVVRICAKEALCVRLAGQQVEALVLERLQIARTDPRIPLDLRQLEPPARTRVTKAAADFEHL